MSVISIETKKKCVELANSGMTSREVYTQYYSLSHDTAFNGFRSMLKKWKKKSFNDEAILEVGNLNYNFTPHAATVQINADGEIVQSWIKSRTSDNLYLELIENIKALPKLEIEPIENIAAEKYMLEIPLYDMHWGINNYEYYKDTLREIESILLKRIYEEVNIIIGQDLFHNDDFRGRTSSGTQIEQVDIVKAWNDARQFYYKIIDLSLKQGKKVKVTYSMGNHDESLSWCFVQMIKAQYDIDIDDLVRDRKIITYGYNFIGVTHGDKVRGKPINLRSIYTIEYPIEFANSKVREIHAGHLHHEKQEDVYGVMCRSLSSANATDDWHYNSGYVGQHKRFTLFEWSIDKLVAIYYV